MIICEMLTARSSPAISALDHDELPQGREAVPGRVRAGRDGVLREEVAEEGVPRLRRVLPLRRPRAPGAVRLEAVVLKDTIEY